MHVYYVVVLLVIYVYVYIKLSSFLSHICVYGRVFQGCDASVLLSSPNGKAEKDHPDNLSLAGDGFDTVVKAKAALDSDPRCRNRVSCADILALATRDVVVLVHTYIHPHHIPCFYIHVYIVLRTTTNTS